MAVKTNTLLTFGASVVAAVVLLGFVSASSAEAAVGWSVGAIADPTYFSPAQSAECNQGESEGVCDRYQIVVRNVGDVASSGTITVTDNLPAGVTTSESGAAGAGWTCTPGVVTTVTCTDEEALAPEAYARRIRVPVIVAGTATGILKNEVTVTGAGAETAGTASEETAISTEAPAFGLTDFNFDAIRIGGGADTRAGGHPYDVSVSFDVSDVFQSIESVVDPVQTVENPRAVVVELPAGLVGNPQATARCPEAKLVKGTEGESACPADSRIGVVSFDSEGRVHTPAEANPPTAIYNMVPEAGYPAEFAFAFARKTIAMYAVVVHTSAGYRLRVTAPGIPAAVLIVGASLTFFGNPGALEEPKGSPVAFLTNPTDCSAGPLSAKIEMDSWENPEHWVSKESTTYPQVTGCNLLQFNPSIQLAPSPSSESGTSQADEPSGYNVDLKVPQTSLFEERATPELKNATVTLPEGVTASPALAGGLVGCKAEGPEGINIGNGKLGHEGQDELDPEATELGAGGPGGNGSPYEDRLYHTARGHCPSASTLGTVEILTPLLASPLHGHIYLAQPKCGGEGQPACTEVSATNGELFTGYIEAEGSGVIIKIPGTISANPQTGQLTGSFKENPQLPFSELKLHFKSGPRAPVANPQTCGAFTTTSTLSSWGGQEVTGPSPSFIVDWDGKGGACPASLPFAPAFSAGMTNPAAGAYSPFVLTFSRQDREQDLSGLTETMPPGLLGKIAGIPLCGDAEANAGTCSPESQIGTTTATAGPGEDPYPVTGGRAYLTTGYKGQPFGLSIVVPAVAGPFNLGNVVVRSAIHIDPSTSQVTVISDPLPQSKDGVPFRLRTVNVEVNRPGGFTFNPTNCAQQPITATITGAQGATANVASPFAVTGCAGLPFKPSFTASTQGKTSKAKGASLTVKIGYTGGQANLHKVNVELPKALPTQLKTLSKACTEAQFNSNPAGCPPHSDIAQITVHTPLLNVPLSGPAILVSHGGAAFPDVEMVLQGEGVELVVDGKTQIKKGITYSHFETIPDAPISSFEFKSPQGEFALFTANGDLCDQKLVMPTSMTGQNGALLTQNTRVEVEGCSPSLSVVSSKVKKQTLTMSVYAPAAGKVIVSGKGVSAGVKTYSGREALTFTLKQNKAGRLKTKIKLTYTPSKGKKQTKEVRASFRS